MDHDVIVVGSGAGGCAAAYHLAQTGRRVLLLERGQPLPRDGSTLDVDQVLRRGAFLDREPWLDGNGRIIVPQERFNLGGKTKWYGAALLRFSPEEFAGDSARRYLPWPIGYDALVPFYEEAERRLGVRSFPAEPTLRRIVAGLAPHGWRPEPLPVGLAPEILAHPLEAQRFDGFASVRGLKSDAEKSFLDPVRQSPNLRIVTGARVSALLPDRDRATRIRGVECADGRRFHAGAVLLAAGALHSPRLLQSYLERHGLAALPCFRQVGRNYKSHFLTALLAVATRPVGDVLRKTTILYHDEFPRSSVQNTGYLDGEIFGSQLPTYVPRWAAGLVGRRAYGFWLTTEDGSHPDNRVMAADGAGFPRLHYDPARLPEAAAEHRRLARTLRRHLLGLGYIGLVKMIPVAGTAHACGTLAAGVDPAQSVVDGDGKVHGLDGVFVVDGSALPRSSRVNPALTIYAWALRVASRLRLPAARDAEGRIPSSAPILP